MNALNNKINFDTTFEHLSKEKPIAPSKIVLLLTIPLTLQKHQAEKKKTSWLKKIRGILAHDFARDWRNEHWEFYEEKVVLPIKHILKEVEQVQPEIILHIHTNYRIFKKMLVFSTI